LKETDELAEVFSLLEGANEISAFLTDLLTPSEIQMLHQRWLLIHFLAKGARPGEVEEETGASRTTIAKARRVVEYGSGMAAELARRLGQA
jgi:TrpR-related protein YerC/YecD